MAWTTPRTWVDQELVTAGLLNTHLRDNLNYLLAPNCQEIKLTNGDKSTTSTTPVDISGLSITLTTNGGPVLVVFDGLFHDNGVLTHFVNLRVDGTDYASGAMMYGALYDSSADPRHHTLAVLITGLAAGSHTFKMRWYVSSDTVTMLANASYPAHFSAIEL